MRTALLQISNRPPMPPVVGCRSRTQTLRSACGKPTHRPPLLRFARLAELDCRGAYVSNISSDGGASSTHFHDCTARSEADSGPQQLGNAAITSGTKPGAGLSSPFRRTAKGRLERPPALVNQRVYD
jgi:hypothetical protein